MTDLLGNRERRGSSGRIPDSKRPDHKLTQKVNVSIEHDTFERLEAYCHDNERARSWVITKAVADWLDKQGY